MTESYHTILIIIISSLAFAFTYFRQKRGGMSLGTHRKIWNIILTVSFLVSAIAGIALAVIIDTGMIISWYRLLLWIHVEAGIIMAASGIIHALWHIAYYKAIFRKPPTIIQTQKTISQ